MLLLRMSLLRLEGSFHFFHSVSKIKLVLIYIFSMRYSIGIILTRCPELKSKFSLLQTYSFDIIVNIIQFVN